MKVYTLRRQQTVPPPRAEVFAFFANAANLERLTPPWLRFSVRTPTPIAMRVGTKIDYTIRWHGLPMRWTAEIVEWSPEEHFVDMQVRGPYRFWLHRHRFIDAPGGGTVIADELQYALPLGWLGRFAHVALVRRDIDRIFDYRVAQVSAILG